MTAKHHEDNKSELAPYRDLWERIQRDVDSLISEIEMTTTQQVSRAVPKDVIFDSVPILRSLKMTRRYADELLHLYPRS